MQEGGNMEAGSANYVWRRRKASVQSAMPVARTEFTMWQREPASDTSNNGGETKRKLYAFPARISPAQHQQEEKQQQQQQQRGEQQQ